MNKDISPLTNNLFWFRIGYEFLCLFSKGEIMENKNEEKKVEVKFVNSFYEKNKIEGIDAFDVQKYLMRILNNSNKKIEDKDDIIKALIYEYSLMVHFIAKSHPEYIDFLNQVKNKTMWDDDSLEWCINPPSIPEDAKLENTLPKNEEEYWESDIFTEPRKYSLTEEEKKKYTWDFENDK